MKSLTLHCICGLERKFTGRNAGNVCQAIDKAGWQDLPDRKKEYGQGHTPGICPGCLADTDDETLARDEEELRS